MSIKKIKKDTVFGMMLLLISLYARAQSGVYLTAADFTGNKLSYESPCIKKGHRRNIYLHEFFMNTPSATVVSNGNKYKLKKKDLYGFRNCNNESYRFYHNQEYRIAGAGGIFIYTQTRNIAQSKGFKVVNIYYFSAGPDGSIFPLSFENLTAVFSGNQKFLDLLGQFSCRNQLSEYDNLHKAFRINYVYNKAMKK
jgi:hypothetical protein